MSGLFGSTTIKGTRLTDFTQTEAAVGKPIPFGYGRFLVNGNVIWARLPPREVRTVKKQGNWLTGKIKTETFTYFTSYAVAFALGPIYGFWWIKRNGKVVYSQDPNAPVEDQEFSTKWLQSATIYNGTMDQLPDSTIEATIGSGKVSAFRGLAYIVVEEEDVTSTGGAVPSYEAVVIASPPEAYITSKPYAQYAQDSAGVSARVGGIVLNQLREEGRAEPERAVYGFAPTGGKLDLPPHGETYEAGTYGFAPTGGKLDLPPRGETYESAQYGFAPTGGDLFSPPFGKVKKENATYGFAPTGGALYWPDANKVMMTQDGKVILDESGKAVKTG